MVGWATVTTVSRPRRRRWGLSRHATCVRYVTVRMPRTRPRPGQRVDELDATRSAEARDPSRCPLDQDLRGQPTIRDSGATWNSSTDVGRGPARVVEAGAGERSSFADDAYAEAARRSPTSPRPEARTSCSRQHRLGGRVRDPSPGPRHRGPGEREHGPRRAPRGHRRQRHRHPRRRGRPGSPIAGMPVLRVWEAGQVVVFKRS